MARTSLFLSLSLLLPLGVTAVGCGSFTTSANRETADDHYNNARSYLKNRDYERSMDQVQRGLVADPDHYGLLLMEGWLHTIAGKQSPEQYDLALQKFDELRDRRSKGAHDYRLWLLSGQSHQGLYQWHRRVASQLRREAEHAATKEAEQKLARAQEHEREVARHLDAAEKDYEILAQREGEGRFPALERLFVLETDRAIGLEADARTKQLERAVARAEEYLKANAYRQEHYSVMVEITPDYEQEALGRETRRELKKRERAFRATYANLLYELGRWSDARKQLDLVIESDAKIAANYYNRARCWVKLGQKNKARRDLQDFTRMTKLPFESPQVTEAYRLLDELQRG